MSPDVPDAPGDWKHAGGDFPDRDGGEIEYEHPEGMVAYAKAMADPDEDSGLVYRPSIIPPGGGPFIEYPKRFSVGDGHNDPRQAALDQLVRWMDQYPEADDVDARGHTTLGAEKQAAENNPYNGGEQ